ncbi:MAG: type IV secretory system conjugative DNA transfer family protein [Bdellovibrionales bacterium]|nr:type IV secretory system conjugative DNA transfer family protein [Bdellovibrionales bacterium]
MKTMCVLLPREEYSQTEAILDAGFKVTKGNIFQQTLTELASLSEIYALEIYTHHQTTSLCFTATGHALDVISGLFYACMPRAEIREIPDFAYDYDENTEIAAAEVRLARSDIYPIKPQNSFQIDSLTPILSTLSRFPQDGKFILQLVLHSCPENALFHYKLRSRIVQDKVQQLFRAKYWFKRGVRQDVEKKILEKTHAALYEVNFRMAVMLPKPSLEGSAADQVQEMMISDRKIEDYLRAMLSSYAEVNTSDLNKLLMGKIRKGPSALQWLQDRELKRPYKLSAGEIASLWHFPFVSEGKNLNMIHSKKGSPPKTLPADRGDSDICFFGKTDYRENIVPFGIRRADRRRHMYVVGKSGAGKSKLLELLVRNDIEAGYGCAVLDPHGDLVDNLLRAIPEERIEDVVIFDPTDLHYPPSFNPLTQVPEDLRMRVTIGFIEIFRKLFPSNWSDRLEHLLRYTLLALLGTPGATLLSVQRMLVDRGYRDVIIANIEDHVVRNFWIEEFPSWQEQHDASVIGPLLNKVGQFVAINMVRNIVGQPINRFDFREIMDTRKILLMKVSKGILGDDNASLLGAMVVSKVYQAAMSRADIPEEQRENFYFYVDEFHNFATSSFDEILSEARKYGLNLTIANQFLGQLPEDVKKNVFGNIGSILAFRVGAEDASYLANEFSPRFGSIDLLNLNVRDFYIKMSINGETQAPFSGRTADVTYPEVDFSQDCIEISRANYCLPIENVNDILSIWGNAA